MRTDLPDTMCVVGIGSNSPDRAARVDAALAWLARTFSPALFSPVYSTPEWSGRYPAYLNAVALLGVASYVGFDDVNASLKLYERRCGRVPSDKLNGIVPVDLDIVVWRGEVCREAEFTRPYFAEGYRMVLEKMSQLTTT
ncbi:2-amino-4-hydroxy-6-hydroxymethyldihydropteridine diphosphokinase [uncultured Muribaculum sp.]|uniref:2-amino-4-hydroxy-6- hydroxymethyldihydropteridine diphosphokinase n=1 Tax=uncultured Muribaculum sp. TaxID=1918613 RepID=UPI0025EB70D6|nr:2-amino-4-hydroxy-6-hydroxymethyldihydropteridine diphosphokinase [uncultured Muribaculum sp.]